MHVGHRLRDLKPVSQCLRIARSYSIEFNKSKYNLGAQGVQHERRYRFSLVNALKTPAALIQ